MARKGNKPTILAKRRIFGGRGTKGLTGLDEHATLGHATCPRNFPAKLRRIWEEFIEPAHWLCVVDIPKAVMFCHLYQEFLDKKGAMSLTRCRELRLLGCDLALDPSTRDRITNRPQEDDEFSGYE